MMAEAADITSAASFLSIVQHSIIKSQRRSINMVPSLSAMEARIVVAKDK